VKALHDPAPTVCAHLRAKGAGVVYGEPVRWESGYYPSAVFWCLGTAEPLGPDDGLVHPHACTDRRVCYCAPAPTADVGHRFSGA
jgi:hypothetical protein